MRQFLLYLSLTGGLFLGVASAAAQVATLDEGTFHIFLNGEQIGTEVFAIRRPSAAANAPVVASAEIRLVEPQGPLELRPVLGGSGVDFVITGYQVTVSRTGQGGDSSQQRIQMEPQNGRLLARVTSDAGLREREYRSAAGTLVLDTGVVHQYFFVAQRFPSGGGTVPVIVPRAGRQLDLRVSEAGRETLVVAGTQVAARRLRVGDGNDVSELWVDERGRVLRLEHPSSGRVAVRQQLPDAGS